MLKKVLMSVTAILISLAIPLSNVAHAEYLFTNVGKVTTNLPKNKQVTICVNDMSGHGDTVKKFVEKYFDGNIESMNINTLDFVSGNGDMNEYNKCDVINYSISHYLFLLGATENEIEKKKQEIIGEEEKHILKLLQSYKGIIVTAAGNEEENTLRQSAIARFKKLHPEYNDRLFVVGQLNEEEDGTYTNPSGYGKQIDLMVPNYEEKIEGKTYTGTSFAAPVLSGIIGTLLEAGIPQEKLNDIIGYNDEQFESRGLKYNVLSILNTYRNAYNYLNQQHFAKQ